jgi:quercetin dioxygenase-like cupin family protein
MATDVERGDAPFVVDLEELRHVADQGIVSRVVIENEHHKIVHFTFAAGQELSEHTASVPAVIEILGGEGVVRLGDDEHTARRGMLFYMTAGLRHAIRAHGELTMLLTMFRT